MILPCQKGLFGVVLFPHKLHDEEHMFHKHSEFMLGWDLHPFTRERCLVKNDNKVLVTVFQNDVKKFS